MQNWFADRDPIPSKSLTFSELSQYVLCVCAQNWESTRIIQTACSRLVHVHHTCMPLTFRTKLSFKQSLVVPRQIMSAQKFNKHWSWPLTYPYPTPNVSWILAFIQCTYQNTSLVTFKRSLIIDNKSLPHKRRRSFTRLLIFKIKFSSKSPTRWLTVSAEMTPVIGSAWGVHGEVTLTFESD